MKEKEIHEEGNQDLGMEARKVRALEKIAMNLEALVMFFESIDVEGWDGRAQWYLSLLKEAYLDPKLPDSRK